MLFTPFGPIKVFVDGIELDYEGSFLLMKMPFQLIRRKIVLKTLLIQTADVPSAKPL